MWHGLSSRPRILIVLTSWRESWPQEEWKGTPNVDVIATTLGTCMPLSDELRLETLGVDARRLLDVLVLLDTSIVPRLLLEEIGGIDRRALEPALASLAERNLIELTSDREPIVDERVRAAARASAAISAALNDQVAVALDASLRAAPYDCVHALRLVGVHAWRLLVDAERSLWTSPAVRALATTLCKTRYRASYDDIARRVLDVAREREPRADAELYDALMLLGGCLRDARELVEGQQIVREALAIAEKMHGPESEALLEPLHLLDNLIGLGICGDATDEQVALDRRMLAIAERARGADDPTLAGAHWSLGLTLAVREEHAAALVEFERAIQIASPHDTFRKECYRAAAVTLSELGRPDEGFEHVRKALEIQRADDVSYTTIPIGSASEIVRKHPEKMGELLEMVEGVLAWPEWSDPSADQETKGRLMAERVKALVALGRAEEAAPIARTAFAMLLPFYGRDRESMRELERAVS
jgi:tetratricopeptide (TPR) repeat protein